MDQNGLSIFNLLRYRQHDHAATLCAFDLIELDGADLRRCPIEERKQHLALILRQPHHGIALNATYDSDSLCARLRGHRLKASWLALPCWPYRPVAQDEKPTCTSRPS